MTIAAREYAIHKHGDQKYGKSDHPYIFHLDGVVAVLELAWDYTGKELQTIRSIGYLHDVLEDTDTSYIELCAVYGKIIADAVEILTHRSNMSYFDYIMSIAFSHNELAMKVKLADLEFNITQSRMQEKLNAYEKARTDKYKLAKYIIADKLEI